MVILFSFCLWARVPPEQLALPVRKPQKKKTNTALRTNTTTFTMNVSNYVREKLIKQSANSQHTIMTFTICLANSSSFYSVTQKKDR